MIKNSMSEILSARPLPAVTPDQTAREAAQTLANLGVAAAVVLEGTTLVGILSERDILHKCLCAEGGTDNVTVRTIMTPDPKTVSLDACIEEALSIMCEGGFRHVPVLHAGRVFGILSINDIPADSRFFLGRGRVYIDHPMYA